MRKQGVALQADVFEKRQAGVEQRNIGFSEPLAEDEAADVLKLFSEIKAPRRRRLILELLRESAKLG